MGDVERQLRAYGDAVEHASSDSPPEPASRRGVFRGTLVAAAVVALALVAVGGVLLARASDDGRARTSSTRPRTRHVVAPVSAELRLDAKIVHQGDDILGTVTFHNRGGAPALLMYRCSPYWRLQLGGIEPPTRVPQHCPMVPANPPGALIPPGRSGVRFAVPTSGRPMGATTVWVTGTRATAQVTIAAARRGPTPCTVPDVTITDDGSVAAATAATVGASVHRLVVMNRSDAACRLDGAPALQVRGAGSDVADGRPQPPPPRFMPDRPVTLQPGGRASALVRITTDAICLAVPYVTEMDLPDGGGRTGVQLRDEAPCVAPTTMTNFAAGAHVGDLSTSDRSPVRTQLRIDATTLRRGEDLLGRVVFRNGSDRTIEARTRGNPGCLQRWYVRIAHRRPGRFVLPADCPQRAVATDPSVIALAPGITSVPVRLDGFVAPTCPRLKTCRPGYSVFSPRRAGATKVWLLLPAAMAKVAPVPIVIGARGPRPPSCHATGVGLRDAGDTAVVSGLAGPVHHIVITNLRKRTCTVDGAPQILNGAALPPPGRAHALVVLAPGGRASFLVGVTPGPPRLHPRRIGVVGGADARQRCDQLVRRDAVRGGDGGDERRGR